jgi:GH24 family phage-related lysozyme (muramidase)
VESGYRCHNHPIYKSKKTTNHCGKALDIHYNILSTGKRTRSTDDMNKIRKEIFNKYLGAKWDWKNGDDIFYLESSTVGATTWIHLDVREFSQKNLVKKYFIKDNLALNGKSIVQLAKELGYAETCACFSEKAIATEVDSEIKSGDRVDPKTLKTSKKGIEFIKAWEGTNIIAGKHKPYNDSEGFCTIGYGHLIDYKKCEQITLTPEFANGIPENKAVELFQGRLVEFEKAIQRDITVNLYQYEFDALVSLIFNTGSEFLNTGGARNGETQIKKKINSKNYSPGADEMSDVTNGGTSGLVKRRKAEINMFKNNVYDSSH